MTIDESEFVFAPLGGLGEIGMNAALYGFGPARGRKWLMVDCGLTFPGPICLASISCCPTFPSSRKSAAIFWGF